MTPPAYLDSGDAVATAAEARKARFWDRIARKYAADPIADAAGYEATLRRVQGLLSPDHAVLEIGCGTGTTALRLAHGTRRYLATDLSCGMLAIARERHAAAPQALPQLQFVRADAERADPGHKTFDAVLAFNVLHLVEDLDRTIATAARALRPGGRFISKTPCIAEMNPLIPRLALPLMKLFGKAPHVLVFDAAVLQAAIERQGLVVEAVERHGTRGRDCRPFIVARAPGAA
jgi:ubiquinone/menaquinone biosynthesis C-methylase UbiE